MPKKEVYMCGNKECSNKKEAKKSAPVLNNELLVQMNLHKIPSQTIEKETTSGRNYWAFCRLRWLHRD